MIMGIIYIFSNDKCLQYFFDINVKTAIKSITITPEIQVNGFAEKTNYKWMTSMESI